MKKKSRHREQVPIKKSNSPAVAQLGMGPQPGSSLAGNERSQGNELNKERDQPGRNLAGKERSQGNELNKEWDQPGRNLAGKERSQGNEQG